MLRRSAPALLGLFVCLLAAHLSSAAPAFHLDESRIRLSFDSASARVRLEVDNGFGRDLAARLRVELVDPKDHVRATAATDVRLHRGSNALDARLELPYEKLVEGERKEFPWYRLRYSVTPAAGTDAPAALEGVVSVSEITPDLFGLTVISAPAARPGSHYSARVRTANPVTQRPLKGIAVEATLTFDGADDESVLKAAGTTDGDGFATLDFELPRTVDTSGDEAELKVTARRGVFVEEAEAEVSVDRAPRVLLTTDKPLYQPGQTVHMRALVFDRGDHALADEEVTFKVEDEEESTAFTATLKTSRFGVAAADWRVPESTRLGTYSLKLAVDEDKYDVEYGSVTDFKVSRYDLPNFSVTAKSDRPFYLAGQNPSVEVRADYLFGQPVRRGRVRVVRQTERRWNYKEQKYETEEHPAVEGELKEGLYVARLDLDEEHEELADNSYERFRDLEFVAYVTDPTTNRTEQRRFQLRLTKDSVHLYVSEGRYRQAKGLPLAFYLATFYADGTPAECDVTVYEERPTTRSLGDDGRVHEVKEADRALVTVRTNRYGVAKVSGPPLGRDESRRNIPLNFVARDRAGRAGKHNEDFWLGYYRRDDVPELRVETDRSVYTAGEPVRVELSSDAERMGVVVEAVAEGRVLHSRSVRLSGGRTALVIQTGEDFAGAVSITATGAAPAHDDGRETYSIGARTIVFPRDRELKLDVKLSQKSFKPGEEAAAQFAVRTADGRRAAGALGVVVFDKAVEERARTDGEAGRGFGFAGSFLDHWYGYWNVAGVTRRDVERLDPARTRPEGFETVAEMLYNNERAYDFHHVTTGTDFDREQARVFAALVEAQLKQLKQAVDKHYANAADYPADEAALVRVLAQAGVDFAALRDPWGQPYLPRFSFERDHDLLTVYSSGADKRPDTDDDFPAAAFSWPYFRKTGEALGRAAADYHQRTGSYVRDLATLLAELRRGGVDEAALRDRWGQPYRFHFGTSGTHFVITVESSGPDRAFASKRSHSPDDFDIWVKLTDYFADSRRAVDEALAGNTRAGRAFPRTRGELAAVLSKSLVAPDALRDGWGRAAYATFANVSRFTDRVAVEARGANGVKRLTRPVTQSVHTLSLRSAGPDGREGTHDDVTLAFYTSVGDEQSARDAEPVPVAAVTTLSGGTGAITGTVTDPNGAAIANAPVTAKHTFAQFELSTTTNDEGVYLLRNLPSGVYKLSFSAPGFQYVEIDNVRVISSNLTKVDTMLSPGAVTETVTVTAGGDQVNATMSATTVSSSVRAVQGVQAPLSTPRLREFFPETLVWSPELETERDGTAQLNFKLADNITTWKMSVIASTEDGRLGTAEQEFLAFQPFFVEHDPPRVLTEGDEISLPVVLRNYLARAQGVDVEMKPESWFTLATAARRRSEVPAGDAARPIFDFRAVASVTDGKQRVTALGADASDAIEKPVTVHPDGEERSITDGTLFSDSAALSAGVPADVIRGSLRGELKVYPNLTAHVLEGVEAIMSRPYGCGEQTISSSYPSVLVLNYHAALKGGGVEESVVARARKYARLGYERLLGYRAEGGGFSYWGRGDADLALSAYALRFLTDASRVIEVDADVIAETRAWLLKQQRPDGSWPAYTWGDHEDKRRGVLTTAFVARVLAATQKFEPAERGPVAQVTPALTLSTDTPAQAAAAKEQTTPLKRALAYVAARADEMDEPYLIASLALLAADAGEPALVARSAKKLRALAVVEGTGTYWALETNTPFYGWGLAGRIETTALAVQALNRYCAMQGAECGAKTDESAAVVNPPSSNSPSDIGVPQLVDRGLIFLLRKKDRYGVWYSTQATINVFDALLSAVAARVGAGSAQTEDVAEIFVNGRNAGRLTLPPSDRLSGPLTLDLAPFLGAGDNRVELRRRAHAAPAQAHLVTTFYVPWSAGAPKRGGASALKLSVGYNRTEGAVSDEVTCSVSAERVGHGGYGMMLAEVGLPPGADVDRASLERAMSESGWALNSYDVLPDRLVVYLWPQGGGTRFKFKFRPRYGLNALTAPSQLYDYYNPEARTVVPPTRFVVR